MVTFYMQQSNKIGEWDLRVLFKVQLYGLFAGQTVENSQQFYLYPKPVK